MRSKKSYKLLIIFGLILFLGIGYAVVNSVTLTVTGTAGAGSETIDVSFNGTKTISNSTKGSANVTAGSTTATFTASNMTLNESITFTYTIQNKETDVAADVTISATGSNSYFTVTASPTSTTIQPRSTSVVTVVVKMIKTPINSSDGSASFTVSINAVPTEPAKEITFTINQTQYTALEGMTWSEFIASPYNIDGFEEFSGNILTINGITNSQIMDANLSDPIIANHQYYTYDD